MDERDQRDFFKYVRINPNHLTEDQFNLILLDLIRHHKGVLHDETFDFLMWQEGRPGRQELFYEYIKTHYRDFFGKNVLEVGCGRTDKLSSMLSKYFSMTAMDPTLEICNDPKVTHVKDFFTQATPISNYDLVIGLEPCQATEHIVRSCVNNNKPFIVLLCATPHNGLNGKIFHQRIFLRAKSWYKYLASIDNSLILEQIDLSDFSPTIIRSRLDSDSI